MKVISQGKSTDAAAVQDCAAAIRERIREDREDEVDVPQKVIGL